MIIIFLKKSLQIKIWFIRFPGVLPLIFMCPLIVCAQSLHFMTVKGHQFFLDEKPAYFVGANYWYGGMLGLQKDAKKGIDRLKAELDFLRSKGVTNLRILAGAEGSGLIIGVERVGPALQISKAVFDEDVLIGLDIVLSEMDKRNMKAVIYLSNNWEWSGGFLQYLKWNDRIADSVFNSKLSWDETRDIVSEFYTCGPCKQDYNKQIGILINRINTVTKIKYIDDPTIMSWEIANEPRPMRPSVIPEYKQWIAAVARTIKTMDKNHLVTIGTEGYIGTENPGVYEAIHADQHIDYLTIHIWPKNWAWFTGTDFAAGMDSVFSKTENYISQHVTIADKLNKPLVIEEFGLPRDGHSFVPGSNTTMRDNYYRFIFAALLKSKNENGPLGGANFWSYAGSIKPVHTHWEKGDEYIGDPPMEEQGLNVVFDSDTSTWDIIFSFYNKIKQ